MKLKNKICVIVILTLGAMQFLRIDKTKLSVDPSKDFISVTNPPKEIKNILMRACYDCHSNQTVYPWYTNVAPVSWWIKHHIDEGKEHLNFSVWADYNTERKKHKLEECYEMVEDREMPLFSYTIVHTTSKLSGKDRDQLIDFFKKEQ